MAHNLTETASYDANVPVPDPGDARTAASVIQAFQPLADRTKWLKQQVPGGLNGTGFIPLSWANDDSGIVSSFKYQFSAWIETDKSAGNKLSCDVIFPDRVTLTNIEVFCTGNVLAGAAHGALPATLPRLTYREITFSGVGVPSITYTTSITDAPGTVAAYETAHVLGGGTGLALSRSIDAFNIAYRLEIEGEQSTNALNNYFGVLGIFYAFTAAP